MLSLQHRRKTAVQTSVHKKNGSSVTKETSNFVPHALELLLPRPQPTLLLSPKAEPCGYVCTLLRQPGCQSRSGLHLVRPAEKRLRRCERTQCPAGPRDEWPSTPERHRVVVRYCVKSLCIWVRHRMSLNRS